MEFVESRLERVQQTKLVFDKRQKDGHYMNDRAPFGRAEYQRQKPRDEEEAEKRKEEEQKLAEELAAKEQKEREDKEDEELLQKEIARLKAEGKIQEETADVRTRTYQRVRKNKKATVHKVDPVQQIKDEIKRRRDAEHEEKAEAQKADEEDIPRVTEGI